MQTKDFVDPEAAMTFCESIQEDNCVDVMKTVDGTFRVNWIPNKMYTALDGKEYIDEVWTKEDGTMIACQDLELEHAKNIIRMLTRNIRERRIAEEEMMQAVQGIMQQSTQTAEDDDNDGLPSCMTDAPTPERVLH